MFGSDYPTPDGTAIRDYIHVSDLADAHVAALRRLLDGKPGGAYNLGTGQGYSVREVLEAIASETGESLTTPMGLRREGDPAELIADASSGRRELGWSPHLSDLETIVRTAWAWHRGAHPKRNAAHELSAAERPDIVSRLMNAAYDLTGKRVWVAGHNGMVGSALVRRLQQVDCTLLTVSHRDLDLTRQRDVEAWVAEQRPQAVFLAAAKVGGIVANDSAPVDFLYDNLAIATNVMHAAAAAGSRSCCFSAPPASTRNSRRSPSRKRRF